MGTCASSAAAEPTLAQEAAAQVVVEHYGVLGKRREGGGEVAAAPAPDGDTVFVDPCNAAFVQDPTFQAAKAGGAARAIYEFLGMSGRFPQSVSAEIKKEGDVAYHRYGYPTSKHVIHAVGYDFRTYAQRELGSVPLTAEVARDLLSALYASILELAAKHGRRKLRLIPVSAGIFAGALLPEMAKITALALLDALDRVFGPTADAARQTYVARIEAIEMCIYTEKDHGPYKRAWAEALRAHAKAAAGGKVS